MILQQDLNGERLAREIVSVFRDAGALERMELNARSLAKGDAAAAAVDLIEELSAAS